MHLCPLAWTTVTLYVVYIFHLQKVQGAARLLTGIWKRKHVTAILASLITGCLYGSALILRFFLFVLKALNGLLVHTNTYLCVCNYVNVTYF